MTEQHPPASASTQETALSTAPVQRLHPMSWLFVLLRQLKQFIIPLLAFLIFGQGDKDEMYSLVFICIMAAYSIWQYYTYHYQLDEDSILINSGLLEKTRRRISFSRIHNVALNQSFLHRLFNVAEVRLESAGGQKPEAEMRVLRMRDAIALEQMIREQQLRQSGAKTLTAEIAPGDSAAAINIAGATPARTLYSMGFGEIMRLGFISNRGMVVVAAFLVAVAQTRPKFSKESTQQVQRDLTNIYTQTNQAISGHAQVTMLDLAIGTIVLIMLGLILVRGLSLLLAWFQYSGFKLEEEGRRLTMERGLFGRLRTSSPKRRIQSYHLSEGILHRLFRRQRLACASAVAEYGEQSRSLSELAPVATPANCNQLIQHLLPKAHWPTTQWQSIHRSAYLRELIWLLFLVGIIASGSLWMLAAPWSYLLIASATLVFLTTTIRNIRFTGFHYDGEVLSLRKGAWTRQWYLVESEKIHALRFSQNPFDRLFKTASLSIDIAGNMPYVRELTLHCVPIALARALQRQLLHDVAKRPLRW